MIDFKKAKSIANKSAAARAEKYRRQGMKVRRAKLAREDARVWTFAAAIPKLQEEGCAPGAIMVSVGKEDGRIFTENDFKTHK